MCSMATHKPGQKTAFRVALGAAAAGAAAAAYMSFEARWIECTEKDLELPGLPAPWSGLKVLHLSDVHAGSPTSNERNLRKVVEWADPLTPDLVLLTGDILGRRETSRPALKLLSSLRPRIGTFAVTGNHEYGLSKAPLARPHETRDLWREAGITILSDTCVLLPPRDDTTIVLCGADHLTGGYGLKKRGAIPRPAQLRTFSVLLVHEPPPSDSRLAKLFPLAFAGHTHGGQLRLPGPSGLVPLNREDYEHLAGVHPWGNGTIVITRGVGTSFLPFRLCTRPEATLWRLV